MKQFMVIIKPYGFRSVTQKAVFVEAENVQQARETAEKLHNAYAVDACEL